MSYGFAGLDAFGRIFNTALTLVDKSNRVKANSAVSFPHLWDSPRADFVQWTGVASNASIGPLARNVGEVVGVFAHIDAGPRPPGFGYQTSVRLKKLIALENRLKSLESPVWPEKILGRLDPALVARGAKIFQQDCATCHQAIDRDYPNRRAVTTVATVDELWTDRLTAANIMKGRGRTGFLKGTWQYVIAGDRFGDEAPALSIVGNTVLRTLVGQVMPFRVDESERIIRLRGELMNRKIDARRSSTAAIRGRRCSKRRVP